MVVSGYEMFVTRGLSGPLYDVDQMPEHFHELFILSGYRQPKSTIMQCILSVFDATNETLNFWTHFLPPWYFFWLLKEQMNFCNDAYTWPLLSYMFACCVFPLASAMAHTFNVLSDTARHICFFIDYGALSLFSLGVAIAYRVYVFPAYLEETWLGRWYLSLSFFNAVYCTLTACQSRFVKPGPIQKILRLGAFSWPYVFDSIPIVYRLFLCSPEECSLSSQMYHARQFVFAITAAFLYATHLPERLHPGRFDIVGHSHQIFHVCSIFGTMDQMRAVLIDMKMRRDTRNVRDHYSLFCSSIGLIFGILILNVLIIVINSYRIRNRVKQNKKDH